MLSVDSLAQVALFFMVWTRLLRFGFRLLYNELAWTYDVVSWLVSLGDWRAWQRVALPFVKGPVVLEIGHGPGHMLLALSAAGYQLIGLDLSHQMGRLAQKRLRQSPTAVSLIRGNVESIPLAAANFNTVLAIFPTEYVVSSATLANVNRVLKENGRFVIVPEGHLTGHTLIHRFIEWLYTITGQRSDPFAVDDSSHFWPAHPIWQPIVEQFTEAGFRLEIEPVQLSRSAVTVLIAYKEVGVTR
jgi:ubiquinone/menaquinone biosynthesis C-methylase UbiE